MNYKIGDKVTVRKDLESGESYENITFNKRMEKYRGLTGTISDIFGKYYRIKEDKSEWFWVKEMFEPVGELIKIKEWEDLDEVENEKYKIIVSGSNYLYICNNGHPNHYASYLVTDALSKQVALDWLRSFGFNVEFGKTIKLTRDEKEILDALVLLGLTYFYRTLLGTLIAKNNDMKYIELRNGVFQFISKGELMQFEDLLKMEVEEC